MTRETQSDLGRICVVGLGYVGLPLAVLLAEKFDVVGFDISARRIDELRRGYDRTREVESSVLKASRLTFWTDPSIIATARVVIVTVPTPIDKANRPDLRPILSASHLVGKHMSPGTVVVYESTVYPGLTEEECVPILELESGLKWREGFHVGYSPERINPGDPEHTVRSIKKIVAGDSPETTRLLAELYGAVIEAGVHLAPNIMTAEAAKVIENTQRDLNIALMNELSMIFLRLGIDTREVLAAAATKWNFLRFEPGLVGGHCIGVDPYYLTFKAESIGYIPQMILAGRRINDGMPKHVAETAVKLLIKAGRRVKGTRVLVLGLTFKEDIPDIRNSKVVDLRRELLEFGVDVDVFDPHADPKEVEMEYGFALKDDVLGEGQYDGVIVAVRHRVFRERFGLSELRRVSSEGTPVLVDVKGIYDPREAASKGFLYWRL